MDTNSPQPKKTQSAYDAVEWDRLSPHAKQAIDQIAAEGGVILHQATDEATLRRFIKIYRALGR